MAAAGAPRRGTPPAAAHARLPQVALQAGAVYCVCLLWFGLGVRGWWEDVVQNVDPFGDLLPAAGLRREGPEGWELYRFAAFAAAVHTAIVVAGMLLGHRVQRLPRGRRAAALAGAAAAFFAACQRALPALRQQVGWVRGLVALFFTDDAEGAAAFALFAPASMTCWLAGAVLFSFTDSRRAGLMPAVVARYVPVVAGFFCAQLLFFSLCVPLWNVAVRHWFAGAALPPAQEPDGGFMRGYTVVAACTHTLTLSLGVATCHWANTAAARLGCGERRGLTSALRGAAWLGLAANLLVAATLCAAFTAAMSRWVSFALRARVPHVWGVASSFLGPDAADAGDGVVWCVLCSPAHVLIMSSYVLWFATGVAFEQRWLGSATNQSPRRRDRDEPLTTPTPYVQAGVATAACGGAVVAALLAAARLGGDGAAAPWELEEVAAACLCAVFTACSLGPWLVVGCCVYLPGALPSCVATPAVLYTLWNAHIQCFIGSIMPFAAGLAGCSWSERVKLWLTWWSCGSWLVVFLPTAGAAAARKVGVPNPRVLCLAAATGIAWLNVAAQFVAYGADRRPTVTLLVTLFHSVYVLQTYILKNAQSTAGERQIAGLPAWRGVWPLVQQYFHLRVVADAPGDTIRAGEPYLLCYHPHGIIPYTSALMGMMPDWQRLFPGVRPRAATDFVTHMIPGMRELLQWSGSIDVSRASIVRALGQRSAVVVIPGGQEEMLESSSWANPIGVSGSHRGFVRLAMQTRTPLVPVFGFGEWELLDNVYLPSLQNFTKRVLGWPFPFIPYGRAAPGQLPRRARMTIVVGAPVRPPDGVDPNDAAAVEALHARYFAALGELFERHKGDAGYADRALDVYDRRRPGSPPPARARAPRAGGGAAPRSP